MFDCLTFLTLKKPQHTLRRTRQRRSGGTIRSTLKQSRALGALGRNKRRPSAV